MVIPMQDGGGGGVIGDLPLTPPTGGGMATSYGNSTYPSAMVQAQGPRIFVGYTGKQRVPDRARGGGGHAIMDGYHQEPGEAHKTAFELLQMFDAFSRADYLKFKNKLIAAGLVSPSAGPADVRDTWASLLQDVYDQQTAGSNVTPFQFINSLIRKNGLNPGKIPAKDGWDPSKAGKGDGFKPSTQTTTSVYDLDPTQAQDLLRSTLQQKLGRDPTDAEMQDFVDAVKTRSANNPTVETTRTMRGDQSALAGPGTQVQVTQQGGHTYSTVQSVDQGFSASDVQSIAEQRAKSMPDYRSYQAYATYVPALENALAATI